MILTIVSTLSAVCVATTYFLYRKVGTLTRQMAYHQYNIDQQNKLLVQMNEDHEAYDRINTLYHKKIDEFIGGKYTYISLPKEAANSPSTPPDSSIDLQTDRE